MNTLDEAVIALHNVARLVEKQIGLDLFLFLQVLQYYAIPSQLRQGYSLCF